MGHEKASVQKSPKVKQSASVFPLASTGSTVIPPYLWFPFLWFQLPTVSSSLKILNGKLLKQTIYKL